MYNIQLHPEKNIFPHNVRLSLILVGEQTFKSLSSSSLLCVMYITQGVNIMAVKTYLFLKN